MWSLSGPCFPPTCLSSGPWAACTRFRLPQSSQQLALLALLEPPSVRFRPSLLCHCPPSALVFRAHPRSPFRLHQLGSQATYRIYKPAILMHAWLRAHASNRISPTPLPQTCISTCQDPLAYSLSKRVPESSVRAQALAPPSVKIHWPTDGPTKRVPESLVGAAGRLVQRLIYPQNKQLTQKPNSQQ